jgi:acetylcholinesterase
MGTHSDYRNASTDFEYKLSEKMQDLWLAFANDPWSGLKRHNWSPYSSNGTALVLGKDGVLVGTASIAQLDSACSV